MKKGKNKYLDDKNARAKKVVNVMAVNYAENSVKHKCRKNRNCGKNFNSWRK